MGDKDLDTRQAAATALVAIGSGAKRYSAQLETALKDGLWEAVLFMQERPPATVNTFMTVRDRTPEEKRREEEERKAWEKKLSEQLWQDHRAFDAKLEQRKDYLLTLLQALDKADPDRLQAINGKAFQEIAMDLISRCPAGHKPWRQGE